MDEGILKEYKKNGPDIVDIVHPAEAFIAFDGQAAQAAAQGYEGYIEAETVEELARKLGIDAQKLQDTIDEYNEMCASGVDTKFHKPQKYLHPITGKRANILSANIIWLLTVLLAACVLINIVKYLLRTICRLKDFTVPVQMPTPFTRQLQLHTSGKIRWGLPSTADVWPVKARPEYIRDCEQ